MLDYFVRLATLDDAQTLYKWRTDPLSMAASHSQAPFTFENHMEWLKRSLEMPTRRIYMAGAYQLTMGMVRADRTDDAKNLSWIIAPQHRGHGHGKAMVRTLVAMLDGPLRAEIKADNIASQKIAIAAGFVLSNESGGIHHYRFR